MKDQLSQKLEDKEIVKRYIKSIDKGLLKVMSKMGISTFQSYCGAQIFDAVGLQLRFHRDLLHRHRDAHRGGRPRRDRAGDGAPPPRRLRRLPGLSQRARCRRRICLPRARRGPCLDRRRRSPPCSTRCAAIRSTSIAPMPRSATSSRSGCSRSAACSRSRPPNRRAARRSRSRRSSRRTASCAASLPAPCPTARFRARRTPRSPLP